MRFSFDMLGEGARTYADARRHYESYARAIDRVGKAQADEDPVGARASANGPRRGARGRPVDPADADGVSVKLSALHPRFEHAQHQAVRRELALALKRLALRAKERGLGLSIDAEEAARLDLTLELFEGLARDADLAGWNGLGFVLQAYQKRAPLVADWLVALAQGGGRRLMVRLVKGAYWDQEVKRAQERGFSDHPVFTRKAHTDLCYEVCAARLLAAGEAVFPQFASHNAHTLSLVLALAADTQRFELQRLHGMGQLLHAQLRREAQPRLRVYAPVGAHRDLLPYLVRRLLENGANSSFVNRFLDARTPVDALLQDPLEAAQAETALRHPRIPAPLDLYRHAGEDRANAKGIDLDDPLSLAALCALRDGATPAACVPDHGWRGRPAAAGGGLANPPADLATAGPIINGRVPSGEGRPIVSPANRTARVGVWTEASRADLDSALQSAAAAQPDWDARGGEERASILNRAADLLEDRCPALMGLIGAEAGRTVADALSEVREAVDFCRYYALQARRKFAEPAALPGPAGEVSELSLHGRGVFLCISPWNFPLAIFTGQVAAALAAGNSVLAKPAEQTPLIAAAAVRLLHEAGVPAAALHLLPGDGAKVGGTLLRDERVSGVAFTGSTQTAQRINRQLAERQGPIPTFIAETGGQNAMLVDSTALPEQVVDDVLASAFQSAGQRCSALRALYLQEEIADVVLEMLAGAMQTLVIGHPLDPATDIGPVIDEAARQTLQAHVDMLRRSARPVAECRLPPACQGGTFFPPCVFEIDSIRLLRREVFGPILHVVRFPAAGLDAALEEINATGYGLTLGIHSRMDGFAEEVFRKTRAGNVYVNRNMVGAAVGVNPFGGCGLSGTGPKAGGPHYLLRFASERTRTDNIAAKGGNVQLLGLEG